MTRVARQGRDYTPGLLALGVAAFSATAFFAHRHLLPLPLFDYWDVLDASYAIRHQGAWEHWQFYWSAFADQTMVFPKLTIDRLAQWTGNRHYGLEIFLGFLAQILVALCVWRLGVETGQDRRNRLRLAMALLLFFWPYLLFRFQHHWYSTEYSWVLAPGVLALYVFFRWPGRWKSLVLIWLLISVSALSHGTGLLLIPAILPALLAGGRWSRWQRVVLSSLLGALFLLVLARLPAGGTSGALALHAPLAEPWVFLRYALSCFGPEFQPDAALVLLALLALAGVRLARGRRLWAGRQWVWNTIILWAVLVALATATTRSALGWGAPPLHYAAFFVLFWYAVFETLLAARLLSWPGWEPGRLLFMVLTLYFLAIYGRGIEAGLHLARSESTRMAQLEERLPYAAVLRFEDLGALFPFPRFRRSILPHLYEAGALPDFVNLESPRRERRLVVDQKPSGRELIVTLPRALDESELIEWRGVPSEAYRVFWLAGGRWVEDPQARINEPLEGTQWLRPSSRIQVGVRDLKIVFQEGGRDAGAMRWTLWRRRARRGGVPRRPASRNRPPERLRRPSDPIQHGQGER